jgi:NAD+--asparagine ADP-ribosyltransferase
LWNLRQLFRPQKQQFSNDLWLHANHSAKNKIELILTLWGNTYVIKLLIFSGLVKAVS